MRGLKITGSDQTTKQIYLGDKKIMVVAALTDPKKGKILVIGLSQGNVDDLISRRYAVVAAKKDHPESLSPLDLGEVVIVYGKTEADILATLNAAIAGSGTAPSRIHPDLFS